MVNIKFKGTAKDMEQTFTDYPTLIAALDKLDLYYDTTPVTFNNIIHGEGTVVPGWIIEPYTFNI